VSDEPDDPKEPDGPDTSEGPDGPDASEEADDTDASDGPDDPDASEEVDEPEEPDEPLAELVSEVDDEEEADADEDRLEELAADAADAEEAFRGPTDARPTDGDPVGGGGEDPLAGGPGSAPAEDDGTPLSDVSREVRRRREREDDDDALFEEAFGDGAADDTDEESLWASLEADDVGGTVEEPSTDSERDVQVVDKREFCERCRYFSAPPDVACGHEGTDILEMEGTDRFKVADCPIVRGEESLGDPGSG